MSIVSAILNRYHLTTVGEVEYLGGAGGFSGAQIWKVHCAERSYCLRRWPRSHPDLERLDWINRVLGHVAIHGCPVANPLMTLGGDRYVRHGEFFWELAPWMKGKANFYLEPNDAKLEDAIKRLAQFHLASAQVNLDFRKSDTAAARYEMLTCAGSLIHQIHRSNVPIHLTSLRQLKDKVLEQGIKKTSELASLIQPFIDEVFPVQPVIRDIWHDHLLYTGDELTGIVDFGAMQMDNVAVDLSRMLGSLVGEQVDRWKAAFDDYSQIRPLSPVEIRLAFALDQCATTLSGLNWLTWILVERREFESWDNVDRRIRDLVAGLSKPDFLI